MTTRTLKEWDAAMDAAMIEEYRAVETQLGAQHNEATLAAMSTLGPDRIVLDARRSVLTATILAARDLRATIEARVGRRAHTHSDACHLLFSGDPEHFLDDEVSRVDDESHPERCDCPHPASAHQRASRPDIADGCTIRSDPFDTECPCSWVPAHPFDTCDDHGECISEPGHAGLHEDNAGMRWQS